MLLEKCKIEVVEQGILDILCRTLELLYYKTTPPSLFTKPFESVNQMNLRQNSEVHAHKIDLHKISIEDYVV